LVGTTSRLRIEPFGRGLLGLVRLLAELKDQIAALEDCRLTFGSR
jgi:hypothetical protein